MSYMWFPTLARLKSLFTILPESASLAVSLGGLLGEPKSHLLFTGNSQVIKSIYIPGLQQDFNKDTSAG